MLHYTLGLPTVWSLWGNQGMARCREVSIFVVFLVDLKIPNVLSKFADL